MSDDSKVRYGRSPSAKTAKSPMDNVDDKSTKTISPMAPKKKGKDYKIFPSKPNRLSGKMS